MNTLPQIYVGIDTGKDFLDVHFNPLGIAFQVENNAKGINTLIRRLSKYDVVQVVYESSGDYEYLLKKKLASKGYKQWQIDPKRIKHFIASEGQNAKTDKIDAEMIALFASQKKAKYEKLTVTPDAERLRALNKRRDDLMATITVENNRLKHPAEKYNRQDIKEHLEYLKKKVKNLDKEIMKLLNNNEEWRNRKEIISSVPGFGKVCSSTFIAALDELGRVNDKEISSLAGVAPFIRQSGTSKGYAVIRGGRSNVRRALYMAAIVAIRYNPKLKAFHEGLIKRGKVFKVAIVAVMRKLIVILNAMLISGERWKVA